MPSSRGQRARVQRPRAAERHQREAARVDAALDRHHAQRAQHLGLGDAHDARGAGARVEPELAREPRHGALGRGAVERQLRPRAACPAGRRPSSRLASVTVGSSPPCP